MPSSVWNRSPRSTPSDSLPIAVGWSPAGANSETTWNREGVTEVSVTQASLPTAPTSPNTRLLGASPSERQRARHVADSHDDDGAQHLPPLHLVERLLHAIEHDGLVDEAVEVEATPAVEVDQHREVA